MRTTTTQAPSVAAYLRAHLWRRPDVAIARMAVRSYLRSGWFWGECVAALLIYAVFFSVYAVSMDTFFGVANFGLGALAIAGTAILTRRAMGARAWLQLAKLSSRGAWVRGLALAAGALRLLLVLLLLLVTLSTGRILQPAIAPLLAGSLGLLMNCLVVSALTLALCPPIATRIEQIGFLAWLVAALYSYSAGQLAGPLADALGVLRLPLLPLAITFNFGATGMPGWSGLLALVVEIAYIAGLVALVALRFRRRDLALH